MLSSPLPTKQQAMNVHTQSYAVLLCEGAEPEIGVQVGGVYLGGEARERSGEMRQAGKGMQMHLAVVPLKGVLLCQLPLATWLLQGIFDSRFFLASWAKQHSAEWSWQPVSPFCTQCTKMQVLVVGSASLHEPGCLL